MSDHYICSEGWDQIRGFDRAHVWHPWTPAILQEQGRLPLFVSGSGCYLYDEAGNRYLDARSAALNASLGYARTDIVQAVAEQLTRLMTFELAGAATIPPARLARKLAEVTPGSLCRCFYCTSGSEATETAIKMARMFHRLRDNPERRKIIGYRGGYHGATMGALALSNSEFNQAGYGPQPDGFLVVDHPSAAPDRSVSPETGLKWLDTVVTQAGASTIAAVFIEPILGIAGVRMPSGNYLNLLREYCSQHGILLIFDEILTGCGRTGRMFAAEYWGVVPDIMLVSKCLTGGYMPLSVVITGEEIFQTFADDPYLGGFRHGHTNSGHAAACAGALAVLEAIQREGLVKNAADKGAHLLAELCHIAAGVSAIVDVRGLGLLIGVEFQTERVAAAFAAESAARQLLVRHQDTVITFAPPLVLSSEQCDFLLSTTKQVLEKVA